MVVEALEGRRLLAAVGPDAFGYRAESQPLPTTDLVPGAPGVHSLATLLDKDDAVEWLDLGANRFNFYGQEYTGRQLFVSTNGLITFEYAHPAFGNVDLGSGAMEYAAIAPLWDDWATKGTGEEQVLYKFELNDLAPDRLIIEWNSVRRVPIPPSTVTFQAVLDLNTGSQPGGITFNYFDLDSGDANAGGASATAGIKAKGQMPPSHLMLPQGSAGGLVVQGQSVRISTAPAPVAHDDEAVGLEDKPVTINVLANDVHPTGGPMTTVLVGSAMNGEVAGNADGSFTYTPPPNFYGIDMFGYQAVDAAGVASGLAMVTVTIGEVNDAPVAGDDAVATAQDMPFSSTVPVYDADNDDGLLDRDDTLTTELVAATSNGTLVLRPDGTYTYAPHTGYYGADHFTYRVSDGRGGSDEGAVTIQVTPATAGSVYVVDDPAVPGQTILVVNGTPGGDVIAIAPGAGGVEVSLDGVLKGLFGPSGRMFVFGYGGGDLIQVAAAVTSPAWVYGDDGNDLVLLGSGGGIAFGGGGTDILVGGANRDILVGGDGGDVIVGNSGDDVLISALTVYDDRFANPSHGLAWASIQAEWNSGRNFADRVRNIRDGGSGTRLNGVFRLNDGTVNDDAANDMFDLLVGGSGNDWFIYQRGEDRVIDRSGTERKYDQVVT
jgi:hypothetical protein